MNLFSPLTLTKTLKSLEVLESVLILLFPVALVTSITLTGILLHLGVFVVLIFLILKNWLKQKIELDLSRFNSINIAFLIYIFAFAFSRLINSGIGACFHSFFRCSEDYFVFFWVIYFLSKNENNKKSLKYFILLAGILSVTYGLFQSCHLDFLHRQENIHRLSGFHKSPYSYGGQLIIFFFFLLNEFFNSRTNKIYLNVFNLFMLLACLFCILYTSERAVILGLFIGFAFYLILKRDNKEKLLTLLAVIFIPILLAINLNKKLLSRIKNALPLPGVNKNVRFKLWNIGLSIWKRNIFFGAGRFPDVYYQPNNEFKIQVLTHAHNVFLQIMVVNGMVGLLAFLNLFFSILSFLFKNIKFKQYEICLISVIIALFVEGCFEFFWGDSEVRYMFLFFSGFVIANSRHCLED